MSSADNLNQSILLQRVRQQLVLLLLLDVPDSGCFEQRTSRNNKTRLMGNVALTTISVQPRLAVTKSSNETDTDR